MISTWHHEYNYNINQHGFKYAIKSSSKMMKFMQNYWGQYDIINKTKIKTKKGIDKIHELISKKI